MKYQIKRGIGSLLIMAVMLCIFSDLSIKKVLAEVNGPEVFAKAYCVMNADTGEVIIEKNQHERMYPASITKVMTALIAIEECQNLEDKITFSETALQISSISSTLQPKAHVGETMGFMDVLYGLLLSSGNECANALAEYNAGSVEAFIEKMNNRAQQIGAVNTHFMNTHGLHDENHYTTAYDMALIFREALKNETFVKVSSTGVYKIPKTNKEKERRCEAGHRMVLGMMPCEGVFAGKSGRTNEAGRTLLTAAKRNDTTLISSLMHSNDDNFYSDTQVLMDYGYGIAEGKYPPVAWQMTNDTVWATANVKIRKYPSSFAIQMGYLAAGKSLPRAATYEKWSRVKVGDTEYYIDSDYLVNDPAQVPVETSALATDSTEPIVTEPPQTTEATVDLSALETAQRQEDLEKEQQNSKNWIEKMKDQFGEDIGFVFLLSIGAILILAVIAILAVKSYNENKKNKKK